MGNFLSLTRPFYSAVCRDALYILNLCKLLSISKSVDLTLISIQDLTAQQRSISLSNLQPASMRCSPSALLAASLFVLYASAQSTTAKNCNIVSAHTVVSDDTFAAIAKTANVTVAQLQAVNTQIPNIRSIKPGDVIVIPDSACEVTGAETTPLAEPTATCSNSTAKTTTVASRDTLTNIAKEKLGITVPALIAANPQIAKAEAINVGDVINIPFCGASIKAATNGTTSGGKDESSSNGTTSGGKASTTSKTSEASKTAKSTATSSGATGGVTPALVSAAATETTTTTSSTSTGPTGTASKTKASKTAKSSASSTSTTGGATAAGTTLTTKTKASKTSASQSPTMD